jgi:hypothetical protein
LYVFRPLILLFAIFTPTYSLSSEPTDDTIEWEVLNRFGPFATQGNAEDLFHRYKLEPGESFADWHKRLSDLGLPSPYQASLKEGQNAGMHWDQRAKQHSEKILSFVQNEASAATTVRAVARVASSSECTWVYNGETNTLHCERGFEFSVPISGANLSVSYQGSEISSWIKPEHVVIVGMGDSYGSGEGNPDYPGQWKAGQTLPGKNNLEWLVDSQRLVSPPEAPDADVNHWVDDTCHRSFYSHQSLTALKLASERPHTYVTFLHYACTGAEIFDGLLVPQYQAWGKGEYVPYSQVNFAIRELCQETPSNYEAVSAEEIGGLNIRSFHRRGGPGNRPRSMSNLNPDPRVDRFSKFTRDLRETNSGKFPQSGFLTCASGNMRQPDYVFLSIGGNDIGFADIVQYFVIPTQWKIKLVGTLLFPEVCPSPSNRVDAKTNRHLDRYCRKLDSKNLYHAGDLTDGHSTSLGMKERYSLLFNVLEKRLAVKPSQIVIPQYPDPMRARVSSQPACEPLSGSDFNVPGDPPREFNPKSAWNGLKAAAPNSLIRTLSRWPGRNLREWHFNLTSSEGALALKQFDRFRSALSKVARDRGVSFVCETRDAFVGYGWWKGGRGNLPNTEPKWPVSDWRPYAYEADTRAIRTGNDTLLTQPGDKRITGAVHPNLTGHRLIAQQVYDKFWSTP